MTLGRTIKGVYVDSAEDARWHIGTLQEACKAAADEARAAGVTHVWVGS